MEGQLGTSSYSYHVHTVGRFIQRKVKVLFTWAVLIVQRYFGKEVNLNYITVAMVVCIVLLSFLIPDLSKGFRGTREVNEMHKIIDLLTEKVKNAESEFLSVADNVCHLHYHVQKAASGEEDLSNTKMLPICTRSSQLLLKIHKEDEEKEGNLFRRMFFPAKKSTSRKEIALMSFVYSNSFNGNRSGNDSVDLPNVTSEFEVATFRESNDIEIVR